MTDQHHGIKNRLVHAYDQTMEHLHALIEGAEKGSENLHHLLEKARDKVVEKDDITREEAEKASEYLKRDLHNASEYLQNSSHNMADWFHMDIELIEWNLIDLFLQVADKTKLELLLLEENVKHINEYRAGEVTGPGSLVCTQCGKALHFLNTGHVPTCSQCQSTQFRRQSR